MARVGRPFEGRQREEARRQARIDRNRVSKKDMIRYTINVRECSTEWSLIQPQKNRSEFIRKCVREYPTLLRKEAAADAKLAEYELLVAIYGKEKREAVAEVIRLRRLLEQHSVVIE